MTFKKKGVIILSVFILAALGHPILYVKAASDEQYTITVIARPGGKIIAPDGSEVVGPSTGFFVFSKNSSAELKFEPDTSKILFDVVVDSFSLGPLTGGTYTFNNITDHHEIIGVFGESSIDIAEAAGDDQIFFPQDSFGQSFNDMISKGISYTKPVVSVDSSNGAQDGDEIYMTFFKPMDKGQWEGNLKKYSLAYRKRTECDERDGPEWTLVDKFGDIAVNCDGTFIESSVSYWSDSSDGGDINKGGVGQLLKDSLVEIDEQTDLTLYYSFRNINTYSDDPSGKIITFNRSNISKDKLGVGDDATRDRIVNYIYGYTYDADLDGRPLDTRDWVLGDIIHSEPKIIDYFNPETGDLQYRYIAVGANDGMLHVFTDTNTVFDGKGRFPGEEIFAFIPTDLLLQLNEMAISSNHTHMVDGTPGLFLSGTSDIDNGYFHKTLVFGERRGGQSYWALDVTDPDPSTWTVKWHITGGKGEIITPLTAQIDELGYTWNKPFFAQIKISESENKNIMIFAGGYDPIEDGFPEAFLDKNYNGAWDIGEAHAATVGGTEGYDKYNPATDEVGRGIFVVDMDDGSLLFKATYDKYVEKTTGVAQTCNAMKYCFPAEISVVPFSKSNLLMYAADIYGQIWKVKYDYYADAINSYESDLSARWTVKPVFTANPGSDLESGVGAELITPFTDSDPDTPGFDNSYQGRKVFYSPDVSFFGNEWTNRPVLYFGTGDRAHPRYTMISNRFYAVVDNNNLIYETNLLNLTCDELDEDADADNDGETGNKDDVLVRENLRALFYNKNVWGFYRIMDKQGICNDSSTDHRGEHILSQPTLFNGIIYFTSYQPIFDDPSNPKGNIFTYALDYSFGTSALNYEIEDQIEYDYKNLEDSSFKVSDSTIPSGIQIITKGGEASGFISTGEKVSGIAENQSMKIPGPPGGISQMFWEIE